MINLKSKLPFIISLVVLALLFSTCSKNPVEDNKEDPDPPTRTNLVKIKGYTSDNIFVNEEGKSFYPWGFNYTNPVRIDLIEDYWDEESAWAVIEEDFKNMKSYSANSLRIHLQFHKFMLDIDKPNQAAMEKLQRLVKLAEENDLYLLVTGLGAYRKSDQPSWYNNLSNKERWQAHASFWKSIAASIGGSPAVFAYDLMNEPVNNVQCPDSIAREECDWLVGDAFGDYHFIQNIALKPDSTETMTAWISQMVKAIKTVDSKSLITVGFLPLGQITKYSEDLDFVSTHIYPESGNIQKSMDYVSSLQSNKPFVLEEFLNLTCTIEELQEFYDAVKPQVNGVYGHYLGTSKEELEASDEVASKLLLQFIEFFIENNPNK